MVILAISISFLRKKNTGNALECLGASRRLLLKNLGLDLDICCGKAAVGARAEEMEVPPFF